MAPAAGTGDGPGTDRPEAHVAWQLASQSLSCGAMGSPLYAHLLTAAAEDVLLGGPLAELLVPAVRPGRGGAAALRLMAAVHRLVLERRAPELALHYPSVGGTPDLRGVHRSFVGTVAQHLDVLPPLLAQGCQTNAVGRCCGLLLGHLAVAATTGLPLRLLEVGASAGLNLRFDHYAYVVPHPDGTRHRLGPPDAEVVFTDHHRTPLEGTPTTLPAVAVRAGCDLAPIDPTSPEGRLRVSSSVWADQVERFARLGGALRTAARVPATVDRASAAPWVRQQLRAPVPGVATVVAHSVVEEYLDDAEREDLHAAVAAAGATATEEAPVAHLRFEPASDVRAAEVTLRLWPHAPTRLRLGTAGAHGQNVHSAHDERASRTL